MNLTRFKKIALATLVVALLVAAAPAPALAAGDTVNFRVENRADRGITIRLYATDGSGRAYYMRVEKETTKTMNPQRGVYTYRLTACGVMVKGTVDLSKNASWIMPQCGHRAGQGSGAAATTDISKILKLISLKIVNRTGHTMKIWLEGPFQYVFIIPNGGSKTVTILKGDYEWGHYACDGVLDEGRISVQETKTRIFECN
jgi:hypothetical protein